MGQRCCIYVHRVTKSQSSQAQAHLQDIPALIGIHLAADATTGITEESFKAVQDIHWWWQ